MEDMDSNAPVDAAAAKIGGLDLADKSSDVSDEDNEFLNSSSFLSNSQIIRSTNVTNFKPSEHDLISSPIRRAKEPALPLLAEAESPPASTESTKSRTHFKILPSTVPAKQFDIDDDTHADDGNDSSTSEDHKSTRFIDIDDPRATPKLPKMHPETTPWRRLRPQSTIRIKDSEMSSFPKPDVTSIHYVQSLFDSNFQSVTSTASSGKSPLRSASLFETNSAMSVDVPTTANISYELENLRKQVTNYKLHQRVLMELIRNLVSSSGVKSEDLKKDIMERLERENDFLINERQSLQQELMNKNEVRNEKEESKLNNKMKEILELKNDLINEKNHNAQLTEYIDDLKAEITRQQSLGNHEEHLEIWRQLLDGILSLLLRVSDGESSRAVQQARDISRSLDTKLNVVKLALTEAIDKFDRAQNRMIQDGRNAENEPPRGFKQQFQDKLNDSRYVEDELRSLLRQQSELVSTLRSEHHSLQKQFKDNLQVITDLKKLLSEKRSKVSELSEKILVLEAQNEELEDFTKSGHQEKESKLLKNRLSIVKVNHSKEVEKLHHEIENLKAQLEEQTRHGDDKKLLDELSRKQTYINELNDEIARLNSRLLSLNREHQAEKVKMKSLLEDSRDDFEGLVREYNSLQQELKEIQEDRVSKERDYKRKLDHAGKELNLAVTKQRSLGAEKSKLTYALEESKRERATLKIHNQNLNEKIGRLSHEVSTLASYEIGFKSLLDLQVHHLHNMLQVFEPLLERSSYAQAQQKLEKLDDSSMDMERTHAVVRSMIAFFENATGSLVTDHKDLMMSYGGSSGNDVLKSRIEELELQVQQYQSKDAGDDDRGSPRSRLRLEDLQKKFKSERERRRVEFDQSHELVGKLEAENRELKKELEQLRSDKAPNS